MEKQNSDVLEDLGLTLKEYLGMIEMEFIKDAMIKSNNNKTQAASILGIKRTTLVEKFRRKG